jgi:hypothetical protein
VQIEVVAGQSVAEIARTLKDKGVIKTVDAFLQVANAEPDASTVQPGFYAFKRKMARPTPSRRCSTRRSASRPGSRCRKACAWTRRSRSWPRTASCRWPTWKRR